MLLLKLVLKNRVSLIGLSVAGALASNTAQIFIATLLLGRGAIYIGLPILITGLKNRYGLGGYYQNSYSYSSNNFIFIHLKPCY